MRIKTRLQISVVVIAVLFFVAGITSRVVSKRLAEKNRLADLAVTIEHDVVDLNLLIHGYLLNHGERSIDQYNLKYQTLGAHLVEARFNQVEEKVLLHDMRSNYHQLGAIFINLISVFNKWKEAGAEQKVAMLEHEKRLSGRLLVKSQILVSAGFRLNNSIKLSAEKTLQKAMLSISILFVILFVFILSISIWIYLSVVPPITQLEKGVEVLGAGNLDYKVATNAKDEIGELSRSFDLMTENLAIITVSRDELSKEIEYRKEVEKKLNQFKLTLDQTLDCVFMFDADTLKFFYVNQGAINQVGYKEKQFFDMTPLDIKPEFTEKIFREMVSPLIDGRKASHTFETVHKHKNGELIPVEVFLQFVTPPNETGRFIAIVRDITERKTADKKQEKLIIELQKAIAEVKILSGLLPICASCKKIRDDKGYWNQIESYISKHSSAEFSHSICPECAKKLYPDLDLYPD